MKASLTLMKVPVAKSNSTAPHFLLRRFKSEVQQGSIDGMAE